MRKRTILAGLLVALLAGLLPAQTVAAQQSDRQEQEPPAQGGPPPPARRRFPNRRPAPDEGEARRPVRERLQRRLMEAIGVTPEQQQRMQEIRREFDDELMALGRRIREARRDLDRAIMSEPYDEAAIERLADELARAQGDQIRLHARMRARVRSVLTPEQVTRFNQLQRRLRRQWMERRQPDRRPPPETDQLDMLSLLELPESANSL